MATVTGLTKARMLEIEAASVVSGAVDLSGHLQLETHGGSFIDAGSVIGPTGPTGPGFIATAIAQITDLNTVVAAGAYSQLTDAWALTAKNYPKENVGGWLTVTTNSTSILQTFVVLRATYDPATYRRESTDNGATWTAWLVEVISTSGGNYRFTRSGYDYNVRVSADGTIDSYDLRSETLPVSPARTLWLNYNSGGHIHLGKPGVTTKTIFANMPVYAEENISGEKDIKLATDNTTVGFKLGNGAVFRAGNNSGGCMIQHASDTGHYVYLANDGTPFARIPAAYDRTTASAANLFVSSLGNLQRSTSLSSAKVNVEDAPEDWAEKILLLKPRTWTDKANLERYSETLDRQLAGEEIDWSEVDVHQLTERFPGFIAEEVQEVGLDIFTTKDVDGNLNGLAYDRITAGLVSVVQKQQEQIDELKALVAALMEE